MSKVQIFGLALALLFILLTNGKNVQADTPVGNCPNFATSDPGDLDSKSDNAQFTIMMGNYFDRNATRWEAEFECGIRHQTVNAFSDAATNSVITARIDRSRNPVEGCEFFPGTHTLLIKGDNVPRCRAEYTVLDADKQCILTIDPEQGITPATVITVSGQNLTDGARFNLFIDDDHNQIARWVDTPSFSAIRIPQEKLSPITHAIYLKRLQEPWTSWAFPWIPINQTLGPILCPLQFTVGSDDNPGGVVPTGSGAGSTYRPCIGPGCTFGGGKIDSNCGTAQDPALLTAIGCIHTSPAALAKDVFTFIIGISGGLAFLMMLLGAFQMLTSAGNPETLNAGRQRLTSATIGLLFVIFAVLLLQIIGFGILKIPGFTP